MAVTLDPVQLVQPYGELSNAYFPQGDLATLIDDWVQTAANKVDADSSIPATKQNDAAAAWVYYTAYSYIATQLAALPNRVSEGDGAISVAYGQYQPEYFASLAATWLGRYHAGRSANSSVGSHFTLASGRRGL